MGVEDMEFPGVLKKYHVEVLRVNLKRSAISRDNQKVLHNFTEFPRIKQALFNFHESWLLTLTFRKGVTQLYRISKGKESFFLSRTF